MKYPIKWSTRRRSFRAQRAHETLREYGSRLFRFVLVTGETGILTDRQLELAEMSGAYASSSTDSPVLADRFSAVRQLIAGAVQRRKHVEPIRIPEPVTTGGTQKGRPAPLQPVPIIRPPAGAYAGSRSDVTF